MSASRRRLIALLLGVLAVPFLLYAVGFVLIAVLAPFAILSGFLPGRRGEDPRVIAGAAAMGLIVCTYLFYGAIRFCVRRSLDSALMFFRALSAALLHRYLLGYYFDKAEPLMLRRFERFGSALLITLLGYLTLAVILRRLCGPRGSPAFEPSSNPTSIDV